jgi:hypothetical protein
MPGPRCFILVKSVHHQNTAQVAREMAGVIGADVAGPDEIPYTSLDQYGLVGFGSGVYYGRMHEALFEWLNGLPDAPEPTQPACSKGARPQIFSHHNRFLSTSARGNFLGGHTLLKLVYIPPKW